MSGKESSNRPRPRVNERFRIAQTNGEVDPNINRKKDQKLKDLMGFIVLMDVAYLFPKEPVCILQYIKSVAGIFGDVTLNNAQLQKVIC